MLRDPSTCRPYGARAGSAVMPVLINMSLLRSWPPPPNEKKLSGAGPLIPENRRAKPGIRCTAQVRHDPFFGPALPRPEFWMGLMVEVPVLRRFRGIK